MKTTCPQHGGAPPHIHNNITAFLNNCLSDLSGLRVSASCPPPSQDLTPPDFCVWGFMEDYVYFPPKPVTLSSLKDRIRTASAKTERPLVQNVWHEFGYRLDMRRQQMGHTLNLQRVEKKLFELSFTNMSFICLANTFLRIILYYPLQYFSTQCIKYASPIQS